MRSNNIIKEFFALPVINQTLINELRAKGVPALALGNSQPYANVLKFAYGRCTADGWFEPDETGEIHFAMLAHDRLGDPHDIVCWHSKSNATASFYGRAFALGEEQLSNPGSFAFDQGLLVHSSVLNWLRAGREGIFILKPDRAFDELRDVPAITAEDRQHGYHLKSLMKPKRLPQILVRKPMQEAA